jgi:hypothetical protein
LGSDSLGSGWLGDFVSLAGSDLLVVDSDADSPAATAFPGPSAHATPCTGATTSPAQITTAARQYRYDLALKCSARPTAFIANPLRP